MITDCNFRDQTAQNAILSRLPAKPGGNTSSCSYTVYDDPFAVLGGLEEIGYKVVAANTTEINSNEAWQIWTLHKQA